MTEEDFLNAVIDDGEAEVQATYLRVDQDEKRRGCLDGFAACRNSSMDDLRRLRDTASAEAMALMRDNSKINYWYWRCYTMQVEWVLNVCNAARYLNGLPYEGVATARGAFKAAEILGIRT